MKKILFAFLITVLFHACTHSKLEGDWPPMKWRAETPVDKASDGTYIVSADGETLAFYCKNYHPWFDNVTCNGKYYELDDSRRSFSTDWVKGEINGKRMLITFEANETGEDKLLEIDVTAGDVFEWFKFRQLAHQP